VRLTAEPLPGTSYTDLDVPDDVLCYYVTAVDAHGEGEPSGSACVSAPPNPPEGLTVTQQDSSTVLLDWSAPTTGPAPVSYHVDRRLDDGPFVRVTSVAVTTTSFADSAVAAGEQCYRVLGVDAEGREGDYSTTACVMVTGNVQRGHATANAAAERLFTVEPNPFNPHTRIRLRLAQPSHVRIGIYNVRGQHIAQLFNHRLDPGEHSVVWSGRTNQGVPAPSGAYFVVVDTGALHHQRKIILLR
jgi:hypothetical protein